MKLSRCSCFSLAAAAARAGARRSSSARLPIIDAYAHPKGRATTATRRSPPTLAARRSRLVFPKAGATAGRALSGDMFWMFPVTAIAYLDQGQLTASARQALRRAWKTYMPYRGDTENHLLLYYTTLYLMAQLWPNQPGDIWYTGKSSEGESGGGAAVDRRLGQADHHARPGRIRFAALHGRLSAADVVPRRLGQGSRDEEARHHDARLSDRRLRAGESGRPLRRRACPRLRAAAAGEVGRRFERFRLALVRRRQPTAVSRQLHLLLSGGQRATSRPRSCKHIATDRSQPYTHYERKRTRNRWRFNDELHGPVYKTTYVRREYAVSSDQGGVLQPIQQHSWDVTWLCRIRAAMQNTFFTLHPYSSTARTADLLRLRSG